jgi:hypothetical protein
LAAAGCVFKLLFWTEALPKLELLVVCGLAAKVDAAAKTASPRTRTMRRARIEGVIDKLNLLEQSAGEPFVEPFLSSKLSHPTFMRFIEPAKTRREFSR